MLPNGHWKAHRQVNEWKKTTSCGSFCKCSISISISPLLLTSVVQLLQGVQYKNAVQSRDSAGTGRPVEYMCLLRQGFNDAFCCEVVKLSEVQVDRIDSSDCLFLLSRLDRQNCLHWSSFEIIQLCILHTHSTRHLAYTHICRHYMSVQNISTHTEIHINNQIQLLQVQFSMHTHPEDALRHAHKDRNIHKHNILCKYTSSPARLCMLCIVLKGNQLGNSCKHRI